MSCAHTDGQHHSCAYVERRNALLPAAEAMARRETAALLGTADYDLWYGVALLRAVDLLWSAPHAWTNVQAVA